MELLAELGLLAYAQRFEEEDLMDLSLLRSMRPDLLLEALVDIGLADAHAQLLHQAVFGTEPSPSVSMACAPVKNMPEDVHNIVSSSVLSSAEMIASSKSSNAEVRATQ